VDALTAYAHRRDERRPRQKSLSFFTSATGTRLLRDNASTIFPRLVREAGIQSSSRRTPKLHDVRHTFAVKTLVSWYRDGLDVEPRLPLLSTWLGHTTPRDTYWYLSAVPELLELIADRIDAAGEVRS
jgi:integrase